MLLKFGIDVVSDSDEKVGELESVIIDPATEEITHLIVKKGFLLSETKLVPISLVADSNDERVKLHAFDGSFESLQNYKETQFIPLANYLNDEVDGKIIPMLFYAPLPVSMPHAVHPATIPVVKENLSISADLQSQSLEEGMDVVALDGMKLGRVTEVFLHPTTDRVTHLLVTKGLLFKKKFLLPVEWLKEIHESTIKLYVDSTVVKKLPAYENQGN